MLQILKIIMKHPEKIVFGPGEERIMDWVSEEAYLRLIYRLILKEVFIWIIRLHLLKKSPGINSIEKSASKGLCG